MVCCLVLTHLEIYLANQNLEMVDKGNCSGTSDDFCDAELHKEWHAIPLPDCKESQT